MVSGAHIKNLAEEKFAELKTPKEILQAIDSS